MALPTLDLEFARAHFPAFAEPSLRDHAYFDSAGATPACRYAIWRLTRFYKERLVAPDAPHSAAEQAAEEVADARVRLAQLLGVMTDEVAFGPSTAQNVYVLANAFSEMLAPGDAIVITDQDHEAISGPWRRLAAHGIEIREWRMDPRGRLDPDDLKVLLDPSVRLVCLPHASGLLGHVNDIGAVARLAQRVGALTLVDGDAYAGHGLPNLSDIRADIYLFSGQLAFGPHQGIMMIRRALAMMLPNQSSAFHADRPIKRLKPTAPDHPQIAACAGIVDYIDALYTRHFTAGRDFKGRAAQVGLMMRAHEAKVIGPLVEALERRRTLRVLGGTEMQGRVPVVSLALEVPGVEAARRLGRRGIMAAGGAFGAPRTLQALGVDPAVGVLRLSLSHYTSAEEVDRLIEALDDIL